MQHNFVAPNINLSDVDDSAAGLLIATEAKEMQVNTVLSNSFGFGGTNSALILRKI